MHQLLHHRSLCPPTFQSKLGPFVIHRAPMEHPPPLAKIDFITNGKKPVDLWKLCVRAKDEWTASVAGVSEQEMAMVDYVKRQCA